ncbi:uncharacterized protein EAE98_009606 [Botrytis deweyae]|uniref:ABM domain-containing protein n=2 Tax=Botrytis TaxID=33196 RepID=A0A4Z1JSN7_9HELO|nr:uncharacterized protein EAE98_009606 [Botrytis deweyae]KAF7918828.1 hypothetical protein EAE98_009606 [Botrytis deweyae]KAF7922230.1 hypothetical protein EAE99_007410 [Botrytis elliptica]TGO76665.1 hypothetical protein BELL_0143g00050 [Botrytis elliptica]
MAPIHFLVTLTPAPGKEARLRETLTDLVNKVEKNEQATHKYQAFEQYDGEKGNVFVLQEIFEDEAAVAAHMGASYASEFGKLLSEEGLVGAPIDIKKIQPFVGFASR